MEHIFKSPNSNRKRIIFVILFSIGMLLFIGYEGQREQRILLEHYGEEQLLLVNQAILFSGARSDFSSLGPDWEPQMRKILSESAVSGSRYWILCREDSIVFLRNESLTKQYGTSDLSSYFSGEENSDFYRMFSEKKSFSTTVNRQGEGELLASVSQFTAGGTAYTLILCTKTSYIMSLNQMLAHQTYLMMAALLLSAVAIIVTLLFNGEITSAKETIHSLREELQKRTLQVTSLSEGQLTLFDQKQSDLYDKKQNHKETDRTRFRSALRGAGRREERKNREEGKYREARKIRRHRQYRLKFYLNTYHFIYINGRPGELHPHTWQMTAQAVNQKDGLILFNEVEQKIDAVLDRFQDKTLNEMEPFDVLNPTLENISEYFKNEFSAVLNQFGWQLIRFECSETPTRAYLIDQSDLLE
ncbi:MAG: 6-pyruvoyl-tetrahydropterin synthase related protein [Bacillota bacterium]|jgi:6-pyruvoyltetrahydropterin/6-carboxytetrahydropterin synthase|nr:6-pyruvoyl-tetrahydropterin synthase related protein [Bacillota bacterium]